MEKATPGQVKSAVALNLKQRHLTQKDAGQMIGFSRQAVANILSNHDYFTEKQAILFSLAFGYDRNYLRSGEGSLFSSDSPAYIRESLEYKDRLLNIHRYANDASKIVLNLVLIKGIDECKALITKTRKMHNFISTISYDPIISTLKANSQSYLEAAERIFYPLYSDIIDICEKEFGVEIEY